MFRIVGFILMSLIVFGGYMALGGNPLNILKPVDLIVIFGGGALGMVIACEMSQLRLMAKQIKQAFQSTQYTQEYYIQLLRLSYELVNVARTKNTKELDKHVESPAESAIFSKYELITKDEDVKNFIVDGYRYVIGVQADAKKAGQVQQHLDEEISELADQYDTPSNKMTMMADSLPALGILMAILSLTIVMSNLDQDILVIGQLIGSALVGTLTGVLGAYCFALPLAKAMGAVATSQIQPLMCVRSTLLEFTRGGSAHLCANAARKHIPIDIKPSFDELEQDVAVLQDIYSASND
ncbi:hypothetical protein A6E01_19095 (plasmid) [Vibrio breoganii]|uniref:Flagellar motor stator protein MotA n=1 Tax=Vibrio breoganii TaxID=553239 RepID=A0AAN0XZ27_9VIBR|nr:motility-associated protein [Vibrio breoganii]ANO35321.1 hypothetical protein A6E01_19095 [Vibrio breoganii]PML12757.1 hypothetical protein BCT84_02410 [Vibrio breoganii]